MSVSLFDRLMVGVLPYMPKWAVWRVAKKYVAGETVADAMAAVSRLSSWGAMATIDVLGEEIHDIGEATIARDAYIEVLDEISRRKADSNVSVKLTAFGLRLDNERCFAHVRDVVKHAASLGNFVRIDMEDSSTTTATLDIYRRLRAEGFTNTGVVLQAYMRRTRDDVKSLAPLVPSYRLCKGIYVESPEIAYKDKEEIRRNYQQTLEDMVAAGSYVGIATHDHAVADRAEAFVKDRSLAKERYEFQMLLGVDETLGRALVSRGHRLRVYVPFGREWHAYCLRRLKENPSIGRYVLLGMFKRS